VAVKTDEIEIPRELKEMHQALTLCIDIMFVNGMPMLTSIDRYIRLRALIALDSRVGRLFFESIDSIYRIYKKGGFSIKWIRDQEFRPVTDNVSDKLDITMNYATASEHVPKTERNNRTFQERIRAAYHNLPYAMIHKIMIRYLVVISTERLNYFPTKGGISPYFSPHVIPTGTSLDFNKHCKFPLGVYVQANIEPNPTNTNAPHTIDCIYLRPFPNLQEGHEVMNLRTGRVITRRNLTEIPVTELVIQAVENMAIQQGITSLKFTSYTRQDIYPADWIAGVEYDNTEDEEYRPVYNQPFGDDEDLDEDIYIRIDRAELEDLVGDHEEPNSNKDEKTMKNKLILKKNKIKKKKKSKLKNNKPMITKTSPIQPQNWRISNNPTRMTIIVLTMTTTSLLSLTKRENQQLENLEGSLQDHPDTTRVNLARSIANI
jgi:hypothetical protein